MKTKSSFFVHFCFYLLLKRGVKSLLAHSALWPAGKTCAGWQLHAVKLNAACKRHNFGPLFQPPKTNIIITDLDR